MQRGAGLDGDGADFTVFGEARPEGCRTSNHSYRPTKLKRQTPRRWSTPMLRHIIRVRRGGLLGQHALGRDHAADHGAQLEEKAMGRRAGGGCAFGAAEL